MLNILFDDMVKNPTLSTITRFQSASARPFREGLITHDEYSWGNSVSLAKMKIISGK